ncbi:FxsB family cyclophane-forming radical SAM/SPASM peptide maturase [Micromonospora sp. WMMD980]|uniref:FxsB family cyclophane-forming radical SAM/SPASM peptide maturase n=1 Tax=Micromonospora sp. WMMD980 TaxID=3016088 RepID=UPI002417F864|nr:FxsB family cyclophane-forming radical SAM/SPASM peptide maturase [Micromonospora sp. WMMD980]MDG4802378.1 FxsB family radical SAM/SPASM domain protein [Micromonospora sp. WMMD980]
MRDAQVGCAPTPLPDDVLDELARNGTDVLRHAIRRVRNEQAAAAPRLARFNNQAGGVPTLRQVTGRGGRAGSAPPVDGARTAPPAGVVPFREFVLKVHSRCNLACDYCYVYRMADQSWRRRPRVMSADVVRRTGERIVEHLRSHGITEADVVLHGGEPLLAGGDRLASLVTELTRLAGPGITLSFAVQTNGTLLDRDMLEMFRRHDIRVGVSVDGDRAATDRHRRRPDGGSSHPAAVRALDLLSGPRYRPLFAGLLATVDLATDPVRAYETLLTFAPPMVDFLLPHGTWTDPPPGRTPDTATPYADWLIAVFERWYAAPRRETRVRMLEEILVLLLGGESGAESVGLSPTAFVVVETDGEIELADTLKATYAGAGATGLSVCSDPFDAALAHPVARAAQRGADRLSALCRRCPVGRVCGGGLHPHRFRAGHGFDNPSVYCPDLFRLIDHVAGRTAGSAATTA